MKLGVALRQLGVANTESAKSIEKLSSGYRINRAGDDAAGLSISEKMRGQIRGLTQASSNAQDGISLIQTAEGALNETHAILQRMRELAVQSATDTNVLKDREAIQGEMNELATEITRIAENTEFNTQNVLDGTFTNATFHIGANDKQNVKLSIGAMDADTLEVGGTAGAITSIDSAGDDITLAAVAKHADTASGNYTVVDLSTNALYGATWAMGLADASGNIVAVGADGAGDSADIDGVTQWLDVKDTSKALITHDASNDIDAGTIINIAGEGIDVSSSQGAADGAIKTINTAIETVSAERSKLGAMQNRLEHTIKNLDTSAENLQASESRIRDVDMAKEMMEQTKQNILAQASTAMLAQANQAPQAVLQLLR